MALADSSSGERQRGHGAAERGPGEQPERHRDHRGRLNALSDDPDELQAELEALAGPAMGPNGGQIYIDGFTGGQLPPKSSILAIRINQNPFSAQYDRAGYGRIEIITKPGTDKFHGGGSIQGQDKIFNTSTPFLGSANSSRTITSCFIPAM